MVILSEASVGLPTFFMAEEEDSEALSILNSSIDLLLQGSVEQVRLPLAEALHLKNEEGTLGRR